MRTCCIRLSCAAALSAMSLSVAPAFAQDIGKSGEHPVQLSQVPAAARDAGQGELGYSNISGVNEKERQGRKIYEFKSKDASGARKQVNVTADGRILQPAKPR